MRVLLLSVVATNLISSGSLQHATPGSKFRSAQGHVLGIRGRGGDGGSMLGTGEACISSSIGSSGGVILWEKLARLRGGGAEDADDDDDQEMGLEGHIGDEGGASAREGEGGGAEVEDRLEVVERGGPLKKGAWTEEDEVEGEMAPITELIRDPSKRPPSHRWKGKMLERSPRGPWDVGNSKMHDLWDEDSSFSETDPEDPDEYLWSDSSEPNIDWDEKVAQPIRPQTSRQ